MTQPTPKKEPPKAMKITRDMRLTFPVDTDNSGIVHVYSLPIARLVFETYVQELGETYSACFKGYDPKHVALTAPQMAYPMLQKVSKRLGTWDETGGVKDGFVAELARLTMVAYAGPEGWKQIPIDTALSREVLDEDTHASIMSDIVFFTLASRVGPKDLMSHSLRAAGAPRDWQFTSSDFTAYLGSLRTSTPKPDTTKKLSSVVS